MLGIGMTHAYHLSAMFPMQQVQVSTNTTNQVGVAITEDLELSKMMNPWPPIQLAQARKK